MLSLTGAGKAEADAIVSRLVKMGNSLRDSGVRDLAATYMKVLSIIGLTYLTGRASPCLTSSATKAGLTMSAACSTWR
jgi:hypothetical protein